jgi:hypothetical protein
MAALAELVLQGVDYIHAPQPIFSWAGVICLMKPTDDQYHPKEDE